MQASYGGQGASSGFTGGYGQGQSSKYQGAGYGQGGMYSAPQRGGRGEGCCAAPIWPDMSVNLDAGYHPSLKPKLRAGLDRLMTFLFLDQEAIRSMDMTTHPPQEATGTPARTETLPTASRRPRYTTPTPTALPRLHTRYARFAYSRCDLAVPLLAQVLLPVTGLPSRQRIPDDAWLKLHVA